MRIGIDARLSGKKHAGIGRYIENLLIRLPLLAPKIQWVYFFHDKSQLAELMQIFGQLNPKPKINVQQFFSQIEIIYAPIRHYTWVEQKQMPKIFQAAKLDLLHVPHFNLPFFYRQPAVITIHDLLWHEKKGAEVTTLPWWQYYLKYFFYKFLTNSAVKRARTILVPTKTVANTLRRYYPRLKKTSKITITHEGFYHVQPTPLSPQLTQKLPPVNQPFLLYVGSLYPHKNIDVVLRAMASPDFPPHLKLYLVGARNVFVDQTRQKVRELGLTQRVIFLGFVNDNELATLYQKAFALLQPSLSEGFGLTGLEAMHNQTLVIASDIPIFREVYDSAAIYFDPTRPADFITALNSITPALSAQHLKLGLAQTKKYDWDQMAQQTLAVYEKSRSSL